MANIKPKRRRFSTAPLLALSLVVLPTMSRADEATVPLTDLPRPVPPTPPPVSFTDADGLKVTALDTERNDLADILGVKMWNFKVELPKPGLRLRTTVEVLQLGAGGQPDKILDTLGDTKTSPIFVQSPTPEADYRNIRVLIGFHESFRDRDLWRSFIRAGNGSVTGSTDALKGFSAGAIDYRATHQQDGSFLLARYGKNNIGTFPAPGEIFIVVRFRLINPEVEATDKATTERP